MKIHIQQPWGISDSLYYKSLIDTPPEGIEYTTPKKRLGMITNPKVFATLKFLKKHSRAIVEKIHLPIPNIHKSNQDCDLTHYAHCLPRGNVGRWVADFESIWQMHISGRDTKEGQEKVLKILKQKNCKKIIAWSEYTQQEISSRFPEIKNKVEVLHYAMKTPKIKKIQHKGINILFVGRYFKEKGGLHSLEVFDRLTKKHNNINCLCIAPVPKNIIEKYSPNKKIRFLNLVPHELMMSKIFPKTDIIIQPGYSDSYGFAFVEAQAFGIPLITVNNFSRKDLVNDGTTGFIIERDKNSSWYPDNKEAERIVNEMVEKASILIEDKKLRMRMVRNGRKAVKEGKFSIKVRNEKLKKIYSEAVK